MIHLSCQPELVAKCILGRDLKETMKNAGVLSLTSKVFQTFINSDEFFCGYAQVMDSGHFLPMLSQTLSSFKDRCFELRGLCSKKTEEFPGVTLGDAWVSEEGVDVFSFFKEFGYYKLKENSVINSIDIPKNMPSNLGNFFHSHPSIAKSKEYLAVHGSDTLVHVFNADGKDYLGTYVEANILQMAIQNNWLYLVAHIGSYSLIVYDLETQEELNRIPLKNYDPSTPICFGKEYLIYSSKLVIGNGVLAHSLSDLREKIHYATLTFGKSYFYPMEDGFIEVYFSDTFVCDILKISFEKGWMKKTFIKKDLKISKEFSGLRTDVCFQNDRLVMAYREGGVGTKLFSYDLLSDSLSELATIPSKEFPQKEELFKPRFLCLAEKIYYLYMTSPGQDQHKSNLTTLSFSKI